MAELKETFTTLRTDIEKLIEEILVLRNTLESIENVDQSSLHDTTNLKEHFSMQSSAREEIQCKKKLFRFLLAKLEHLARSSGLFLLSQEASFVHSAFVQLIPANLADDETIALVHQILDIVDQKITDYIARYNKIITLLDQAIEHANRQELCYPHLQELHTTFRDNRIELPSTKKTAKFRQYIDSIFLPHLENYIGRTRVEFMKPLPPELQSELNYFAKKFSKIPH